MDVLKWILANWDSIIVVIAMIVITVVLVKRGETTILKQILFNLVTKAEQEYGTGTGSLKYATVADWLYQRIPNVLKLLFTSKDIEKMIESALEAAKEKWGTNPNIKEFTICDVCGHTSEHSHESVTIDQHELASKDEQPNAIEEAVEVAADANIPDDDSDVINLDESDPSDAPVG